MAVEINELLFFSKKWRCYGGSVEGRVNREDEAQVHTFYYETGG